MNTYNHAHRGSIELLQVADAVAQDKKIPRESIIEAMEQAIQVAGRRKYGHEHNIKAEIDRKTGEIRLFRELEIVETVEDSFKQQSLADSLFNNPNAKIGDIIYDPLPPIDLGRVAAQTAKQVITQKVRDAERDRQYEEFKNRVGEVINGIIKRIEFGHATIDLGRAEAILNRNSMIKNESFRQGDRVRAHIEDVRRENKGPQIFLSRTSNDFLAKLFAQEVPEIYDGVIEIKAVARETGSRAKMAVYTRDSGLDPVGSCVGIRGARVQAVSNELQGEKIDIIQWSSDPATFVVNALAPAEVSKVVIDEDKHRIEVIVPGEQLSLAIGRRGQNVRLASQLTGWSIDVLTEDEESKRRVDEFNNISQLFMDALDVEEVLAQLLAAEGFSSLEDIAYTSLEDLMSIEGFDEGLAQELHSRASAYLNKQNAELQNTLDSLGFSSELQQLLNGISHSNLVKLAESGIKSLEDLAELSEKEFKEIIPNSGLNSYQIQEIIDIAKKSETNN